MKFRLFNLITGLGILSALCFYHSSAEAIFASVKSTGMAATSISHPIDSFAGAYNPAGIAVVGNRFDIEGAWVYDKGHSNVYGNPSNFINGNYAGMREKNIFPVNLGITASKPIGSDIDLAFGVVVYNRNYQKTTYKEPLILFGTSKLGLEYLNETVSPILAVKWCNTHTLGISLNYQLERLKVNGLQNFDNVLLSVAPGHVTNRGYGYSYGWGFTLGYFGQITDKITIGATYQPKTEMSSIKKYKGFLANHGKLNIPEKIGAGVSFRVLPCVVIAFDVEHIKWKAIQALSNEFPSSAPLGAKNGPGFGFRNQWYYRLGMEWEITQCLAVRAGYRHSESPIKKSQTAVNILTLDAVEDFVTAGATLRLNANSEISVVGAYGFNNKIKGRKSIPSAFEGGEVNLTEEKFAIGLAWALLF